jgi:hypothetical protein
MKIHRIFLVIPQEITEGQEKKTKTLIFNRAYFYSTTYKLNIFKRRFSKKGFNDLHHIQI